METSEGGIPQGFFWAICGSRAFPVVSASVAVGQKWTVLSDVPRSFAVAGVSADAFVKIKWVDWRFVRRLIPVRMLEQALEHPL